MLRDASGLVVDRLNYGGVVDPWSAEGYQGTSGLEQIGCHVPTPGADMTYEPAAVMAAGTNTSAGSPTAQIPIATATIFRRKPLRLCLPLRKPARRTSGSTAWQVSMLARKL